jgi:hypothetical protein
MLGAAAEHIISHKQGFVLIFRTPEEWMQSTKDAFKSNDLPFKEL